jgi:hypothetical protein
MELASPLVALEPTELEAEREELLQVPLETPNLPVEVVGSVLTGPLEGVVGERAVQMGLARTELTEIQVTVPVAGVVVQTTVPLAAHRQAQ